MRSTVTPLLLARQVLQRVPTIIQHARRTPPAS